MPVLETVRDISFLSTILELYSEITLFRKPFGIGYMYIYTFLLGMTDTMASQNNKCFSWDTLYAIIIANFSFSTALRKKHKTEREM
jgi:hypothetical protein